MFEFLRILFSSDPYMPHAHCFLGVAGLIWLHVISDALIGLSYVSISATLVYLVYRGRRDIPFHSMFLAFGLFIIACGATHFMEIWTLWRATYWLSGTIKGITALASLVTAAALPPLVPMILAMIRAARESDENKQNLERTHAELQEVHARLRDFDELKTQFFANVSHELRTPLTLIIGPTEQLLSTDRLDPDQRRSLEVVQRNAQTLLKHVNDLLDVSRLEAGRLEVDYTETDLASLVRLSASHFEILATERRIDFRLEVPEVATAQTDPDKVQRIVLNLLSNAFKFTPPGGVIRCRLEVTAGGSSAPGQAVLTVADSGPGIPPEMREAIFERFRQADGGVTRSHGGTGLGLAIVRDFVRLHRGTIAVESAEEGGALFRVTLPLTAPAGTKVRTEPDAPVDGDRARQTLAELRAQVEVVPSEQPGERPTVLVVEDNPEMNRFVAEILSDRYHVSTASDGREGLMAARRLRPDLILSDVMMPAMSGDQLVAAVRAEPELERTPIMLLTAKADDELRVQMLREGAQDYVMKPFSPEELRARVDNLVVMKRARDVLQQELSTQVVDLELLATEVTSRKQELQAALDSMRVALDYAEKSSQVKSNFLRLVSHELRTPLTVLQLQLQRLERDAEQTMTERQRTIIDRISGASRRLLDLIESLLEYARIESGRLQLHVEPTDLNFLVGEVVSELEPQASRRNLEIRFSPTTEVPLLASDPRLIRLILVNLIGNAIKFTDEGYVEVRVGIEQDLHRVTVRDTGPGIPKEQQSVVFEPFAHLEPVHQKHTPGVGLGLALVREMTTALGGTIELESEEGRGATFTLFIPRAGG